MSDPDLLISDLKPTVHSSQSIIDVVDQNNQVFMDQMGINVKTDPSFIDPGLSNINNDPQGDLKAKGAIPKAQKPNKTKQTRKPIDASVKGIKAIRPRNNLLPIFYTDVQQFLRQVNI